MILRKPYAFFIRHFKFIHVIMTVMLGYLILKTNLILNFLNTYMETKELVTGKELVEPLFGMEIYAVIGVFLLLSIVIIVLMNFKKKPFTFYFINIMVALGLLFIFYFSQTIIGTMEERVVELKTIRLVRDFLTIAILLETTSLLVCFIRSVGFNLKQFNFEKDYQELNITAEDNEEFELELNVDTDSLRRRWLKRIRYFKYNYQEHKFVINLILLFLILALVFVVSFVLGAFDKKFDEKEYFTTEQYVMGIDDSYVTTKDYKGNVIKENSKYVIVKINLKNRYDVDNRFIIATSYLISGEEKFYHQSNNKDKFVDLGIVYSDQLLTTEPTDYLLVYELPVDYDVQKLTFAFQNIGDSILYDVKLNPKNLDEDKKVTEYKLGDSIEINDIISADVLINSYELSRRFKLNYDFCITDNECYNSSEYLYPTLSGRNEKALLKLTGNMKLEENNGTDIKSLEQLIGYFGNLEYIINGKTKTQKSGFKRVEPVTAKSTDYYLEVNEDILKAEKIYLNIVVRNNTYRYLLK